MMRGLASFLTIIFGITPATYLCAAAVFGVLVGFPSVAVGKTEVLGINSLVLSITSVLGIVGYVGLFRVVDARPTLKVCIMLCCGIAGGLGIVVYFWMTDGAIWTEKSFFPYFVLSAAIVAFAHLASFTWPGTSGSNRK